MQDRIKPLDGVRNFRDFGAYQGADGRQIRSGVLYRSAQFGEASSDDVLGDPTAHVSGGTVNL
ncbi:MAG: tyrosine-protein phosphatase [Henriciella sp.]|nr:tyrosine-protein phosphatase [Henriciella sp.]